MRVNANDVSGGARARADGPEIWRRIFHLLRCSGSGSVRRFGSYRSVARQPMYGTKYRVRGNQPGRRQPRHSDPTIHFGGAAYILVAACRRRPVSAFARCRAMLDCARSSRRRRHITPLHLHTPSITSKPTSIGAFVAFYQTDNALRKWKCGVNQLAR
jgi:hypothetical protein